MSDLPLVKITATTAAEVCAHLNLSKEARSILRDDMAPSDFLNALAAANQHVASLDFLACALPVRESIWWGSLCLQQAFGSSLSNLEREAAIAAVRFVLGPTAENSSGAKFPAQAAGPATVPGALALAAAQGGANTASSVGQVTSGKAVANAVKLASVKGNPAKFSDTQRLYVELGIGVADGRFVIPEMTPARYREKWDWEVQEEEV